MKTKALRLYGKKDLRLEEFELPPIGEEELLVKVISDSLCMSSYKSASQGAEHKRVPDDVAQNPTIIGHEFAGEIIGVGARLKGRYTEGGRFSIQPAMRGTYQAAGYSFPFLGGDTQYAVIPKCYIDQDCVLPYSGDAWFYASMSEPISCVIGATHASYHTEVGDYTHHMGIRAGGKMAALAAAGPMGLALIDYVIHSDRRPSLLVVTDIDEARLARAASILTAEEAERHGVRLVYLNTSTVGDPVYALREAADRGGAGGGGSRVGDGIGGGGFDDVFALAPVPAVVEQADAILAHDGCLNFFAGPSDQAFSAKFNFYNVHYNATHIVGTSGGNTDDMREALELSAAGRINPAILVTHIGGLDAAREATLHLPEIPGGKKLIYTHISLPLTAIADFREAGVKNPIFAELDRLCERSGRLWNGDAERFLLENAEPI
ncbi:MAG: zinc-binding dehydrogenase [Clostridiales bacterium]|jgi:threonine dehydrogenase-like Zn-dependent dehydrogenase|nr:zinc-binding dehydrogenase [Clostridiales bacterium]